MCLRDAGLRGGVVGTPAAQAVCAPLRASDLLQRLVQRCDPRAAVAAEVCCLSPHASLGLSLGLPGTLCSSLRLTSSERSFPSGRREAPS